jgi:hypothetical protein
MEAQLIETRQLCEGLRLVLFARAPNIDDARLLIDEILDHIDDMLELLDDAGEYEDEDEDEDDEEDEDEEDEVSGD